MNQPTQGQPAPAPAQQPQPQPQPQQPQPQPQPQPQQRAPMYRPEHMSRLPILTDVEKEKYEKGLRQLYDIMEKNSQETPAYQGALKKVTDFSRMVYNKINSHRMGGQAAAGGQAGQAAGQAQNPALAAQRAAATSAQRPAGTPGAGPNTGAGAGAANAGGAPAGQAPQPQKIPTHIVSHVQSMAFYAPPHLAGNKEQAAQWINSAKQRYTRALVLMDTTQKRIKHIDHVIKDREAKGNPLVGDELKKYTDAKNADLKHYSENSKLAEDFRRQLESHKAAALQSAGGQARPQQGQNAGTQALQAGTASVSAAMEAAKGQQMATANRGTPATPTTQAAPGPAGAVQTSAPPVTQPQAATTAPLQAQVKVEPGTSQAHPHPPPVNTALATAANAAAASSNLPSAGTPTQNSARVQTPQTATSMGLGNAAKPLTHSAALQIANTRQNSTTSIPLAGQANGTGITTTPGSAGLMGNASQSSHSHAHPQPTTTMAHKMPIPKQLPENATKIPQGVSMGGGVAPGRPTMGAGNGVAGGPIGQPVIAKAPAFTFEAEGEHVLSKKKLDELVRQVCGGGPAGADGNYLTPDVEESVLSVADNFVDNVLHMACRLAKERGSKVLEIRDIQLVLERVYNIRVPGHTSEELRTVRKAQPSSAWIAKMSAVQAAKVMPGKDDK